MTDQLTLDERPASKLKVEPLLTEHAVYAAIVKTYPTPAYAVLPGVADGTGHHKRRTVDAVVMGCWPSRGIELAGVEIKVSRSDWRRELKDPAKQETIARFCDRFWLAVGDADIVKDGELPQTWGLLVPGRDGRMRVEVEAPKLEPQPITRPFLASLLRRANEALEGGEVRARIEAEVRAEVAEELARLRENQQNASTQLELKRLYERCALLEKFEGLTGLRFGSWSTRPDAIERAAALVRADHTAETARANALRIVKQFQRINERLGQELAAAMEQIEPENPQIGEDR